MTPDPTAPATSRAEFDQRQAARREAYSAKLDELAANVKTALEMHEAANHALNQARRAEQTLREERSQHLDGVLAKIDRRAAAIPGEYKATLQKSARRISSGPAAKLPAVGELGAWLKPDLTLNTKRVDQWKAAVVQAAEHEGSISTRPMEDIEGEVVKAKAAAAQAQKAERKAYEAVTEARRAAHEFQIAP
jgi:hypothetical protein